MGGKLTKVGLAVLLLIVVGIASYYYYIKTHVHYGDVWVPSETSQTQSGGKVGLGVIVEYADGRIQEADPRQIQFTLFPLTVYCSGEPIKRITWVVYVYLDWTGELTCLELKGPIRAEAGSVRLRTENMWKKTGVNMQLSDVKKANYFEMWRMWLDAVDIEAALGSGKYRIVATANVTATAMFSTGVTSTKSAVVQAGIEIQIEAAGLKTMLIDIQTSALRG